VNSGKAAKGTLAQAEKQAGQMLAQAGIEVVWMDCSAGEVGACAQALGPAEFWLHVASSTHTASSAEEVGFTAVDRNSETGPILAGVYYPMVKEMAATFIIGEAHILGATLAHEIGHLLGEGHSTTGAMSRQFNGRHVVAMAQGGLLLTRDQAARMRAEVMRRTTVPAASADTGNYGPRQIADNRSGGRA
jgi:hypothetical protein